MPAAKVPRVDERGGADRIRTGETVHAPKGGVLRRTYAESAPDIASDHVRFAVDGCVAKKLLRAVIARLLGRKP